MKRIENIVFYKKFDQQVEANGACIFYQDGTHEVVSYSDGVDACKAFMNEKGITSLSAFQKMVNNECIYLMSYEDLLRNFSKFVAHDSLTKDSISEVIEQRLGTVDFHNVEENNNIEITSGLSDRVVRGATLHSDVKEELAREKEKVRARRKAAAQKRLVKSARALNLTQEQYQEIIFAVRKPTILNAILGTKGFEDITFKRAKDRTEEEKEIYSAEKERVIREIADVMEKNPGTSALDAIESLYSLNVTYRTNGRAPIVIPTNSKKEDSVATVTTEEPIMRIHKVDIAEDNIRDLGDNVVVVREKKEGFITRAWNSLKENSGKVLKKVAKIAVYTGAVALAVCGIRSCSKHISKEGFMFSNSFRNGTMENPLDDSDSFYVNTVRNQTNSYLPTEWFYQTTTPTVGNVTVVDDELLPTATVEVLDNEIEGTPAAPISPTPTATISDENGSMDALTDDTAVLLNSCGVPVECPVTPVGFYDEETKEWLVRNNNHYYNNYTYEQLLKVTENETQKRAMMNIRNAIFGFNVDFADAYVEKGKDIRAALTFDEVVALHQAYNDFSKDQLLAIFNGAEINSSKMSDDYKSATLQLMGAHIIENSAHPVDMSMLLETEEGREFYQRYHAMFLAAKESTGKEQLKNVKKFYDAIRHDFPITVPVRTEGISHADSYASLDSYKLSVIPMIAASEMLFQNLEVDYTMNDTEINFFNDIGLCNEAFHSFQRAEMIGLACCPVSCENPLYEQYRNAIIAKLKAMNRYVIDDEHRELTKLDIFQKMIEKFNIREGEWVFVGSTYIITSTSTTVSQWTETHTTYRTVQQRIEAPIPEEEKAKIDAEIAAENEQARIEAEAAAEQVAQQLQNEADQRTQQILEEIAADEADLQQDIADANAQIEMNHDGNPANDNPVMESDFGEHNVNFYDQYEDGTGTGTLGEFVENITTDPTGVTYDPLPDPNETGAAFDAAYQDSYVPSYDDVISGDSSSYGAPTSDYTDPGSSYVENVSDNAWIEYPTDYSSTGSNDYGYNDYSSTGSYDYGYNDYSSTGSNDYGYNDYSSAGSNDYGYNDYSSTGSNDYGYTDYSSAGSNDYGYNDYSSTGSYDYGYNDYSSAGSNDYEYNDYSSTGSYDYGYNDYSSTGYTQYVSDDAWIEFPTDFSSYQGGESYEFTR